MRDRYRGNYAGFLVRLIAFIIDGIIVLFPISFGIKMAAPFMSGSVPITTGDTFIVYFFGGLPYMLYYVLFWFFFQATPGKMLCKLTIVNAKDGGKLGMLQCFLRCIGYSVSNIVFWLGFIWVLFDDRKQGWHDKIAGTVVVKG